MSPHQKHTRYPDYTKLLLTYVAQMHLVHGIHLDMVTVFYTSRYCYHTKEHLMIITTHYHLLSNPLMETSFPTDKSLVNFLMLQSVLYHRLHFCIPQLYLINLLMYKFYFQGLL